MSQPVSLTELLHNYGPGGVVATGGTCGGKPRLAGHRLAVMFIEKYRRAGETEATTLEDFCLRAAELVNAWIYIRDHPEEIERQIEADNRALEPDPDTIVVDIKRAELMPDGGLRPDAAARLKAAHTEYKTIILKLEPDPNAAPIPSEPAIPLSELLARYGPDGITMLDGVAVIADICLPVYLIEALRRDGISEQEILANYTELHCTDLVNVWQYVLDHPAEIEAHMKRP